MKVPVISLGLIIAVAIGAFWIRQNHRPNLAQDARARAAHFDDLRKRNKAELEDDRVERETEVLLWDAPQQLTQQRVLVAQELIDTQAQQKEFALEGRSP